MIIKKPKIEVKKTVEGLKKYQKSILLLKLFVHPKNYLIRANKQISQ